MTEDVIFLRGVFMKLNKIICIVCIVLIAASTIFHTLTAFADTSETDSDLWTAFTNFYNTVVSSNKATASAFADVLSTGYEVVAEEVNGLAQNIVRASDKSIAEDFFYYIQDGELWIDDTGVSGGGGGRRRVSDGDDLYMSGETFAEICDRLADQYAPDAKTEYISWRCKTSSPLPQQLPIYQYGEGLVGGSDICYFQPFFLTEEGDYYFSDYQYELKIIDTVLHVAGMNVLSESEFTSLSSINNTLNISSYPYISLLAYPYYVSGYTYRRPMTMFGFASYTKYLQDKNDNVWAAYGNDQKYGYYFNHDLSHQVDIKYIYESFSGDPVEGEVKDIGYYISTEPIDMNGRIQPIPLENLTDTAVNFTGDNIYDYTIINEAGDTSTVNYFITNNYTYENTYIPPDSGDSDGDTTINNNWGVSFGDFIINIGTTIETSINNSFNYLFVPSETYFTEITNEWETDLNDKIPIVAEAPSLFSSLFIDLVEFDTSEDAQQAALDAGINQSSTTVLASDNGEYIAYPKWTININYFGKQMKLTVLDFSTFADLLPAIRSVILVFVYVVYIWHFLQSLPSLIGNVVSAGKMVSAQISKEE